MNILLEHLRTQRLQKEAAESEEERKRKEGERLIQHLRMRREIAESRVPSKISVGEVVKDTLKGAGRDVIEGTKRVAKAVPHAVTAVPEMALSTATTLGPALVGIGAGLARGAGKAVTGVAEGTVTNPKDFLRAFKDYRPDVEEFAEKAAPIAYQPRSDIAKAGMEGLGGAMEKFDKATFSNKKLLEVISEDPEVAAGGMALIEGLAMILGPKIARGIKNIKNPLAMDKQIRIIVKKNKPAAMQQLQKTAEPKAAPKPGTVEAFIDDLPVGKPPEPLPEGVGKTGIKPANQEIAAKMRRHYDELKAGAAIDEAALADVPKPDALLEALRQRWAKTEVKPVPQPPVPEPVVPKPVAPTPVAPAPIVPKPDIPYGNLPDAELRKLAKAGDDAALAERRARMSSRRESRKDKGWGEADEVADIDYYPEPTPEPTPAPPKPPPMSPPKPQPSVRKQADGSYRVFEPGTSTDLLPGQKFSSAVEAVNAYMNREIATELKGKGPTVGLATQPVPPSQAQRAAQQQAHAFMGKNEAVYQAMKPHKKTVGDILNTVRDKLETAWHKTSRVYENLPETPETAVAVNALKTLEKQPQVQFNSALRMVQGINIKNNPVEFDLFTRRAILADAVQELKAGRKTPFEWDYPTAVRELQMLDAKIAQNPLAADAVKKRAMVRQAVLDDLIDSAKKLGVDLTETLSKEDYFPHKIMQETESAFKVGKTGDKLRVPTKRERWFLRKREGGEALYSADYLNVETEVLAQMLYDTQVNKTLKVMKDKYDAYPGMKAQAKATGANISDMPIPDGHTAWSPFDSHIYRSVWTVPEKLANEIFNGTIGEITADQLRKARALGKGRQPWIIPKELAATLDTVFAKPTGGIAAKAKQATGMVKAWLLFGPRRFTKYRLRNLSGDLEAVAMGNPSSLKKVPVATKELYDYIYRHKPPTPEMAEYIKRGGFEGTFTAQELGRLQKLPIFKHLLETEKLNWTSLQNFPGNLWKAYWRRIPELNSFLESQLRYANFLDYLEQMKANKGVPKNFGASKREIVMALPDVFDRAYELQNRLVGAYDMLGKFGQTMRSTPYPFFSWKEVNLKRFVGLHRNAFKDFRATVDGAKNLGIHAAKHGTVAALKAGRVWLRLAGYMSLFEAWNQYQLSRDPDLRKDMPKDETDRFHLLFGRNDAGEVQYFSRMGAFGDILGTFGLDAGPRLMRRYMEGDIDLKDVGKEIAKEAFSEHFLGLNPLIQTPFELVSGGEFFPDPTRPRKIRDTGLYIAKKLSLDNEYKAMTDIPARPYKKSLPGFAIYTSSPLDTNYYQWNDIKSEWTQKAGGGGGSADSPRNNALYYWKLGLRYGDERAIKRYRDEYISYHMLDNSLYGKPEGEVIKSIVNGMKTSLRNMHPLSGMNEWQRKSLLESLNSEEKETLKKAIQFWEEVLMQGVPRQ